MTDPVLPAATTIPGDLLREDYVTCLAEDSDASLWVGHRQCGVELYYRNTKHRLIPDTTDALKSDFVTCLLPDGPCLWAGRYGAGLSMFYGNDITSPKVLGESAVVPLPTPATPPTVAELQTMLARVKSLKGEMPVGGGAFLGEDWRTLGDWVGRYGRQYAVLCAIASPMDQIYTWDSNYEVQGQLGPHHTPDDALRHWLQPGMVNTPRLASLYSPVNGFRSQAEWDDHGETYPQTFEGPDVWVSVKVPEGTYRVSLYDTNKDGHDGDNSLRDYQVDLLPYRAKIDDVLNLPPLAHTRIHNFWNGFYTSFLVRGPSQYYVHVAKNGSKNTIVAGVFIDKLSGPKLRSDDSAMAGMFGVRYMAPDPDVFEPSSNYLSPPTEHIRTPILLSTARSVWDSLDVAQKNINSVSCQHAYRLLAYRASLTAVPPVRLRENWRWHLHLWTLGDRQWFQSNMEMADGIKKAGPPSY